MTTTQIYIKSERLGGGGGGEPGKMMLELSTGLPPPPPEAEVVSSSSSPCRDVTSLTNLATCNAIIVEHASSGCGDVGGGGGAGGDTTNYSSASEFQFKSLAHHQQLQPAETTEDPSALKIEYSGVEEIVKTSDDPEAFKENIIIISSVPEEEEEEESRPYSPAGVTSTDPSSIPIPVVPVKVEVEEELVVGEPIVVVATEEELVGEPMVVVTTEEEEEQITEEVVVGQMEEEESVTTGEGDEENSSSSSSSEGETILPDLEEDPDLLDDDPKIEIEPDQLFTIHELKAVEYEYANDPPPTRKSFPADQVAPMIVAPAPLPPPTVKVEESSGPPTTMEQWDEEDDAHYSHGANSVELGEVKYRPPEKVLPSPSLSSPPVKKRRLAPNAQKNAGGSHRELKKEEKLNRIGKEWCKICKKAFASRRTLSNHRKTFHRNGGDARLQPAVPPPPPPPPSKRFKTKKTSRSRLLDNHNHLHKCISADCTAAGTAFFPSKKELDDHWETEHSKVCKSCGKEFGSRFSLRRHRYSTHKEELDLQFACGLAGCDKRFEYEVEIKWHHRNKHEVDSVADSKVKRKHWCPVCGLGFATRFTLQRHAKSLHDYDIPNASDGGLQYQSSSSPSSF